jgi:putative holliday junction resolvase
MSKNRLTNTMALDVGAKRIGVAIATTDMTIPRSLGIIEPDDDTWAELKMLCSDHQIKKIVVGLPRSLEGNETAQTKKVREFSEQLKKNLNLPVSMQDEALTSFEAERALKMTAMPHTKGDVDAMSARLILEDYLQSSGLV